MSTPGGTDEERRTYAVVGSTGKATTAYLLEHVLHALGRSTALATTVEEAVAGHRDPVERGERPDLDDVLTRADAVATDDVVLEVGWADLADGALAGRTVDLALFTHLDVELEGADAGARLDLAIAQLTAAGRAVVLVDDDGGQEAARRVPGAVTVGTRSKGPDADWQVTHNASRADHCDFTLTHRGGRSVSTSLWLPTRFSVGFAALALAAVLETGTTGATLNRVLPKGLRPVVPGRVERVADHPRCVVDIAHEASRLSRVLAPLAATTRGRLVVVVGARAADSPAERRRLGRAAAAADSVVVTDDDHGPDDDAAEIRADVLAGVREVGGSRVAEVSPRQAAIRGAVALAGRDDTVLVAGRGHLTRLEIGDAVVHLDDREEVRAGLAQREHRDASTG